jgi:two-component system sensor histidine kinase UhpB
MESPPDRATLEQIARTALQSLDDVRRIGRELRPEALDDLGLGSALIALCRRMAVPGEVRVLHALEPGLPALQPEVDLVIYRIAQEAVTNALRHAGATVVQVALGDRGAVIELVITDDGRGMPDDLPADTAGLAGMRERARLVAGRLAVEDAPGGGTRVVLRIPHAEAIA